MSETILVVLAVAGVLLTLAVGWSLLVLSKRIAEANRDLLKAVLAHSQNKQAVLLAGSMEGTDRAVGVEEVQRPGVHLGYPPGRVPREVGS